jgi:putative tryptophan/tyrosine transport system substrate-binding protein
MRSGTIGLMMTLVLGLLAAPLLAAAQEPGKVYRIGWLDDEAEHFRQAFLEQFRALGWVEGQNFVMEYPTFPSVEFRDRALALAAEFVRRNVDIIVAGGTPGAFAAKAATATIPIVMAGSSNPVEQGIIESLARPGGTITGVTNNPGPEFRGKQLQVFREAVPGISRVGILRNPLTVPGTPDDEEREEHVVKDYQTQAQKLGLVAFVVTVKDASEYADVFALLTREHVDALYVSATSLNTGNAKLITDFALRQRLPIFTNSDAILSSGGLIRYRANSADSRRLSAFYVDKILKGAKPGELPVQRPDKFELTLNLKTAKVLGITIPPSVLIQATKVIQ